MYWPCVELVAVMIKSYLIASEFLEYRFSIWCNFFWDASILVIQVFHVVDSPEIDVRSNITGLSHQRVPSGHGLLIKPEWLCLAELFGEFLDLTLLTLECS